MFVFEKFVKICRDLDNSSEKKNSDWGLKMEVEERLEKFEATVENTNTKVGMLHTYFLNSLKDFKFSYLIDENDVLR